MLLLQNEQLRRVREGRQPETQAALRGVHEYVWFTAAPQKVPVRLALLVLRCVVSVRSTGDATAGARLPATLTVVLPVARITCWSVGTRATTANVAAVVSVGALVTRTVRPFTTTPQAVSVCVRVAASMPDPDPSSVPVSVPELWALPPAGQGVVRSMGIDEALAAVVPSLSLAHGTTSPTMAALVRWGADRQGPLLPRYWPPRRSPAGLPSSESATRVS